MKKEEIPVFELLKLLKDRTDTLEQIMLFVQKNDFKTLGDLTSFTEDELRQKGLEEKALEWLKDVFKCEFSLSFTAKPQPEPKARAKKTETPAAEKKAESGEKGAKKPGSGAPPRSRLEKHYGFRKAAR